MASFFFWIIVIVVSFLIGGVSIFLFLGLIGVIKDLFVTRGIPRNRKKLAEYLKQEEIKKKFKNPGKPTDSEKEVLKEDERRRAKKFREFERLRREELKGRIGKNQIGEPGPKGSEPIQQQPKLFQDKPNREPNNDSVRNPKTKPRVSLYD